MATNGLCWRFDGWVLAGKTLPCGSPRASERLATIPTGGVLKAKWSHATTQLPATAQALCGCRFKPSFTAIAIGVPSTT
jgi:hypothetical protein